MKLINFCLFMVLVFSLHAEDKIKIKTDSGDVKAVIKTKDYGVKVEFENKILKGKTTKKGKRRHYCPKPLRIPAANDIHNNVSSFRHNPGYTTENNNNEKTG